MKHLAQVLYLSERKLGFEAEAKRFLRRVGKVAMLLGSYTNLMPGRTRSRRKNATRLPMERQFDSII